MSFLTYFTITAPTVSEEEEQAERAALSEVERRQYYDEVFGTEIEITETKEIIRNGLQLLESALDSLTLESKQDYQDALNRVPELVESESPRISFLRGCKYDAWAAARRLVDYWSTRKKVFGEQRAFLPMTLQGAMAEDVQYLEKAVLFPLKEDDYRRAVVFMDRVRWTKDIVPRDSVVRCFWYVLQTYVENETYQQNGYVIVSNNRGCVNFDRILTKKMLWVIGCLPVHMKAVHMCTGPGPSFTKDLALPVLRQMGGREFRQRYQLHAGSSLEILAQIKQYGLGEPHVQAVFAGDIGNEPRLQSWVQDRFLAEEAR